MTPLRTTEAISSQTSGILTDGGYLDNDFATQEEAEIGTSETTIMSPLRTRESITEILATEEEAAAGLVNNKLMTPLRTAEAIAELAQGGMTLNETVIVADYSLGLEDVGSVRLVGDSDLVEVVYEIEDLVTFNVNFTPAESTGDYVGY